MKLLLPLLFGFFACTLAFGQNYPKDYFGYPINPPFILAGTFGEIRPDHIHTGIDFSTKEIEGLPVYAAADGYVSRIKVSADGFGKALYITHPNHYVTVYAHLSKYSEVIEKYVRKKQYEKETFEIELFPDANEFKVKKGGQVASSGNTGGSAGPHLHFEIRDEKTEEPLNPALFGYSIPDIIKPEIKSIRIVPVKGKGSVNNSDEPKSFDAVKTKEGALAVSDEIKVSGTVGFEVKAVDFQNGSQSELGIYSLQLSIDNQSIFGLKYDRLNFSDLRFVNAHIDYAAKYDGLGVYERCFKLPTDKLKIYDEQSHTLISRVLTDGYFNFPRDGVHQVEINTSDMNGNTQSIKFTVYSSRFSQSMTLENNQENLITPDNNFSFKENDVEVSIPANAVYEACHFSFSKTSSSKYYSEMYKIGDPHEPLQLSMNISIKPALLAQSLIKKATIVSIDKDGKQHYEGGAFQNGALSTKTRHFGTFTVAVDTLAPVITIESLPANGKKSLKIKITDDLAGIKSYKALIDGKWNLMEYDKKNNLLKGDLQALNRNKKHQLKLIVEDAVGNETVLNKNFFY